MAKSRADGTPAKAGRKASPAKSIKASPAKSIKSKAATPERTTRSSPRRTVPSAKAQEAAADYVQTGRIAKKASPSKATTPAKKASPKKAVKATTPAKEASPEKTTKRTTPEKKVPSTKNSPSKSTPTKKAALSSQERDLAISHGFAWYVKHEGIIDYLETAETFNMGAITRCYARLLQHKAELDGNARAADSEETRQLRPMYRKVKKNMRSLLGAGFDEFLKTGTRSEVLASALRKNLGTRGVVDPADRITLQTEIPRESMPAIHVTAQDLEEAKEFQDRADRMRAERRAERIKASGLTPEEYRNQVLAGRVAKPASRAASRSRSPAKSPIKREREASVSRPVRARSQSPKKAATRTASKSPAPVGRPATRSRSPAEVANAQPTDTGRKSRSKSPAKAPARRASKSPAPIETTNTRSRSPAKAKEASPAPLKVAKTRSKSPVKADASPATGRTRGTSKSPARKDSLYKPTGDDDEDEPGKSLQRCVDPDQRNDVPPEPQPQKTTKKSPVKRAASVSEKSPSPAKRVRSASPAKAKATSAPTASRARSTSPLKRSQRPPRALDASTRPPHPNEPGRGGIISPTNPQTIPSLNKPNPFHETLPAPEIWHRRMPPYFPFGETPFMEREISRQIEEDLARGE